MTADDKTTPGQPGQPGSRRVSVPPHVAVKRFAAETVLLNIRSGQYHSLDDVGSTFLEELTEGPTISSAAQRLAERFEQPLERLEDDLARFVAELDERDLVSFDS